MTTLTLLTRDGCHLCDDMKVVIATAQLAHPVQIDEIDISTRPELARRFGTEIPILLRGDEVIARHRITERELLEALTN